MDVRAEPVDGLGELAAIPAAFRVERLLRVTVTAGGLGGIALAEEPVATPWLKDYDAREGPGAWAERFDVSGWGLLVARDGDRRLGAAVIARDTPGLHMLRDRPDAAALWDLRVRPEARRTGVGARLFEAAAAWAAGRGCTTLLVETQNVNVAACRLYRRMGCTLASIDRLAYPDLPHEVQLVWSKQLA